MHQRSLFQPGMQLLLFHHKLLQVLLRTFYYPLLNFMLLFRRRNNRLLLRYLSQTPKFLRHPFRQGSATTFNQGIMVATDVERFGHGGLCPAQDCPDSGGLYTWFCYGLFLLHGLKKDLTA
jgi:hypothetical protein